MSASASQTGCSRAEPEEVSALRASPPRAGSLLDRLRSTEHRGLYANGGGKIDATGNVTMWGGEKIMEARNPDGSQAAELIELLGNTLRSIRGVGSLTRQEIDNALRALAKARGDQ